MSVLVFGPSGAGKTYLSQELKKMGLHAVDADDIKELHSWYDGQGNKITFPENAGEEFLDNHSFLWDTPALLAFLNNNSDIYIFGVSGNVLDMLRYFDRVFYLDVPEDVQDERLQHETRENPMGRTEYQRKNAIAWGRGLREKAKELGIPFIDATLTPKEIYQKLHSLMA
jgi:dephospho-CoA kinase